MLTRMTRTAALVAGLMTFAAAAQAVTYTLDIVVDYDPSDAFTAHLVVDTPDFVTSVASLAPTSCTIAGANPYGYVCGNSFTFDPVGDLGSGATGQTFLGFRYGDPASPDSSTGFLWFDTGAFSTPGTYALFQGVIQDPQGGYYGNFASSGTLVVSGVPEPGSVALLLAGAGVAGWVVRRRG